jgi:hypothetical protein
LQHPSLAQLDPQVLAELPLAIRQVRPLPRGLGRHFCPPFRCFTAVACVAALRLLLTAACACSSCKVRNG